VRAAIYDDATAVDLTMFIGVASKSHRSIAKCDIYQSGVLIQADVPIESGSVTVDRTAAIRARCNVKIIDTTILPTPTGGITTPAGYELRLWRGIRLRSRAAWAVYSDFITHNGEYVTHNGQFVVLGSDGSIYGEDIEEKNAWVSLGYFAIQTLAVSGKDYSQTIVGEDRSRTVADAGLDDALVWATSDSLEVKIEEILRKSLPSIPFIAQYQGSSHNSAAVTHERGANPNDVVLKSAQAVGNEAYWDHHGIFVWRPEPDLRSAVPVTQVWEGPGGVLIDLTVNYDRRPAYNAAPVIGENPTSSAEIYSLAIDDDPLSPSYYYGPFGKKPAPAFRDSQIDTQDKADAAAAARLAANLGVVRSLDLTAVPNPVLEPGDAIHIRRLPIHVDEVAIIETQTIGLGSDQSMSMTCRTKVLY
jgi:hypothetical protein